MKLSSTFLIACLTASLSASAYAGPSARNVRSAKPGAGSTAAKVKARTKAPLGTRSQSKLSTRELKPSKTAKERSSFRYGTPLHTLEEGNFALMKSLLNEFRAGALKDTFEDKAHTTTVDRVNLEPKYAAYDAEVKALARSNRGNSNFDYVAADRAIFNRYFEGTGIRDWRHYGSLNVSSRKAWAVERTVETKTASSPLHQAVRELDHLATSDRAAGKMLKAALKDPLTLALVIQVGEAAELGRNSSPASRSAQKIYDAYAKVLQAEDREYRGAGLEHIFPETKELWHFKSSSDMSFALASQRNQIMNLPREQIMKAAKGVLSKAELNEAIIGLDL